MDCYQGRIQDFGQGDPNRKFAQNRGFFPLKLPENCMIVEKILDAGGGADPQGPLDPPVGLS